VARERRLADLARPGQEHHLGPQVLADRGFEVPCSVPLIHGRILPQSKKSHDFFGVSAKIAEPRGGGRREIGSRVCFGGGRRTSLRRSPVTALRE
jgi:hypothetical protein